MILNIKASPKYSNIIVHYLSKDRDRYNKNFCSEVFNFVSMSKLLPVLKTIITGKDNNMLAEEFIKLIGAVAAKRYFPASTNSIIYSINSETTDPLILSRLYINKEPIPKIKRINIINDKIYFMIRTYPNNNYDLELVEYEKFNCIIQKNSIFNLYRSIKKVNTKQPKTKTISNIAHEFADSTVINTKELLDNMYTQQIIRLPRSPRQEQTQPPLYTRQHNSTSDGTHRFTGSADFEQQLEVNFDFSETGVRVDSSD